MLVIDLLKYVLPGDADKQCGHYILVTGLRLRQRRLYDNLNTKTEP